MQTDNAAQTRNDVRITPIDPAHADGKVRTMLDAVQKKLGITPNMMKTMAHAPAVLEGYLGFNGALASGKLRPSVREQIALEVAQANGCDYCLSAHTLLGKLAGLSPDAIASARRGEASDPGAAAALRFSRRVLEARGAVSDADIEEARRSGLGDAEIAEVVAHVALNVLTNFFNNVARTEIDFPVVRH